jgi:uncharacterized DUF497 family protein
MAGFDWDQANIKHIAKYKITPDEAEQVVLNDPIDLSMQSHDGEERTPQVGETDAGRVLVVVTAWRDGLIRVVTAFPAKLALRKLYFAQRGSANAGGIEEAEFQE